MSEEFAGSRPARPLSVSRYWVFVVALSIGVLLAYQPVWHAGFIWDDAAHVTRADLRSWQGLRTIWSTPGATQQYYPLTHSFFWLLHQLWGDAAPLYHVANILLHIAAASLAALLLTRLAVPGAYWIAAIFALHPVQVESVAWISEIKNTLSAVFYFSAAVAWLRYVDNRHAGTYALSFAFFVLALGSKTVTATLPAALLVVQWWRSGHLAWRRDVLPLVPFFIVGAAAGIATAWVERSLVGAEGTAYALTPIERGLVAARASWFYLGKLLWPAHLAFNYPRWNIDHGTAWLYIYPAAAIAVLAAAWTIRGKWRGPLAAVLYFGGTLFPALGFVNVYPFVFSFVADHFQYLASLGPIALATAGLTHILEQRRPWGRPVRNATGVIALSVLGFMTWKQAHIYANVESLYRATIEANAESWMSHNNLAGVLIARGADAEAVAHIERALALRPDYAEARNNLGLVLVRRGRLEEARLQFETALAIQPQYAEAHNNLGFVLARLGKLDEAIDHYRRALEIDPGLARAHHNLAQALIARSAFDEALVHFRRALALEPDNAEAHNNLGVVLAREGRFEEAITQFEEALSLDPASRTIRDNLDAARNGARGGGKTPPSRP